MYSVTTIPDNCSFSPPRIPSASSSPVCQPCIIDFLDFKPRQLYIPPIGNRGPIENFELFLSLLRVEAFPRELVFKASLISKLTLKMCRLIIQSIAQTIDSDIILSSQNPIMDFVRVITFNKPKNHDNYPFCGDVTYGSEKYIDINEAALRAAYKGDQGLIDYLKKRNAGWIYNIVGSILGKSMVSIPKPYGIDNSVLITLLDSFHNEDPNLIPIGNINGLRAYISLYHALVNKLMPLIYLLVRTRRIRDGCLCAINKLIDNSRFNDIEYLVCDSFLRDNMDVDGLFEKLSESGTITTIKRIIPYVTPRKIEVIWRVYEDAVVRGETSIAVSLLTLFRPTPTQIVKTIKSIPGGYGLSTILDRWGPQPNEDIRDVIWALVSSGEMKLFDEVIDKWNIKRQSMVCAAKMSLLMRVSHKMKSNMFRSYIASISKYPREIATDIARKYAYVFGIVLLRRARMGDVETIDILLKWPFVYESTTLNMVILDVGSEKIRRLLVNVDNARVISETTSEFGMYQVLMIDALASMNAEMIEFYGQVGRKRKWVLNEPIMIDD